MNWAIAILPFLEEDNLFKRYDDTVPNIDPANGPVHTTFLKVYTCPSDPQTEAGNGDRQRRRADRESRRRNRRCEVVVVRPINPRMEEAPNESNGSTS
jgi:hypothetical protein